MILFEIFSQVFIQPYERDGSYSVCHTEYDPSHLYGRLMITCIMGSKTGLLYIFLLLVNFFSVYALNNGFCS